MERYHLHVLKTKKEVKHALNYVLFNQQKHENGTCSTIDEYSSVLFLKNGMNLVRNFAKKKKIMIKIQKGDPWIPDTGRSYLYLMSFSENL